MKLPVAVLESSPKNVSCVQGASHRKVVGAVPNTILNTNWQAKSVRTRNPSRAHHVVCIPCVPRSVHDLNSSSMQCGKLALFRISAQIGLAKRKKNTSLGFGTHEQPPLHVVLWKKTMHHVVLYKKTMHRYLSVYKDTTIENTTKQLKATWLFGGPAHPLLK